MNNVDMGHEPLCFSILIPVKLLIKTAIMIGDETTNELEY